MDNNKKRPSIAGVQIATSFPGSLFFGKKKDPGNEVVQIDHFTVVAVLPGLWLKARLPVTLF